MIIIIKINIVIIQMMMMRMIKILVIIEFAIMKQVWEDKSSIRVIQMFPPIRAMT